LGQGKGASKCIGGKEWGGRRGGRISAAPLITVVPANQMKGGGKGRSFWPEEIRAAKILPNLFVRGLRWKVLQEKRGRKRAKTVNITLKFLKKLDGAGHCVTRLYGEATESPRNRNNK